MEKEKSSSIVIKKEDLWKYSTIILLAIVIVGGFTIFGGDDSPQVRDEGIQPNSAAPQIAKVTADDDPFLGPEDAEIVVIEFSDFECPYCGAAEGTHQGLIDRFKQSNPSWEASVPKLRELAEQGKIKFVFRDFPLSGHRNAQKASEAAECAEDQDKYWEYHDELFNNQDALEISSLKAYAQQLGLDMGEFNNCLDSGKYAEEVRKDLAEGQAAGVRGTPAFFVNGELISGAQPFSAFESALGL